MKLTKGGEIFDCTMVYLFIFKSGPGLAKKHRDDFGAHQTRHNIDDRCHDNDGRTLENRRVVPHGIQSAPAAESYPPEMLQTCLSELQPLRAQLEAVSAADGPPLAERRLRLTGTRSMNIFKCSFPYGNLRAGIEASGAAAPGPMGFSLESRNKSGIPE
ncbi:MAG: hypothetical protein ACRD88_11500 [Terriglobia bacterium]